MQIYTKREKRDMKRYGMIFIIACMVVCFIPLVGMTVHPTTVSTENKRMSEFPELKTEEGDVNLDFFEEFEDYFNEHFAFRNELVYADAMIQTGLFHVSSVDSVISGSDGWLYYASTLDDYLGQDNMTERQIYNLVHNISLACQYVESKGSSFVLAIPPNKNTLYGEYMPYYDSYIVEDTHNIDLLAPKLKEAGIPYADLTELFRGENEILYLKRDSHWNEKGAVLAYNCIMDTLNYSHMDYGDSQVTRAKDEDGDLNRMLYTLYGEKEMNYRYEVEQKYTYVNDVESVEDVWIETEGGTGNGALLMFRDSFGNTLLPYMADQFENAWFTKETPYGLESLMEQYQPDTVVFEKVERNISEFISKPPIISAPETETPRTVWGVESGTTISMGSLDYDYQYYKIGGSVDEDLLNEETDIVVCIDGICHEAYHIGANEYELYIPKEEILSYPVEIEVLLRDADTYRSVQKKIIEEGEILP